MDIVVRKNHKLLYHMDHFPRIFHRECQEGVVCLSVIGSIFFLRLMNISNVSKVSFVDVRTVFEYSIVPLPLLMPSSSEKTCIYYGGPYLLLRGAIVNRTKYC